MSKQKNEGRVTTITTPSPYGSSSSMIYDGCVGIEISDSQVICEDDIGLYVTDRSRLDTGLADPNRYSANRKLKKPILT